MDEPVSAGPSQCQWSPWGSQPTDSVGLGEVGVTLDVVSSLEDADAEADAEAAVDAGPSQCLLGGNKKIRKGQI